jgi:Amt family ammonium transporter
MILTGNMFDLHQMMVQIIGIGAAFVWVFYKAFAMYYIILKYTIYCKSIKFGLS